MKPKIEKLVGIPIAVVHRATPSIWELHANVKENPKRGDSPSQRFISRPIQVPMQEWKNGIMLPGPPPIPKYFDGRAIRDRFMDLRRDADILNFLNQYGTFSPLGEMEETKGWSRADLDGWQMVFAQLAKRQPNKWQEYADSLLSARSQFDSRGVLSALNFSSRHEVEFRWGGVPQTGWFGAKHLAVLQTTTVVSAILATIEIDHLRGARFGVCARDDCPKFFEITSRHSRKYCSEYCAHLESVRRTRERQKRERTKSHVKSKARLGQM